MRAQLFFARKGVPDVEGVVYDDVFLPALREFVQGPNPVVTIGFDMTRPLGTARRVIEAGDGNVYLEIEVSEQQAREVKAFFPDLAHLSVAAPGGFFTRNPDGSLVGAELMQIGLVGHEESYWRHISLEGREYPWLN